MTERKTTLAIAGVSLAAAIAGVGLTAGALPAVAETDSSSETRTESGPHEANGITEEQLTGDTADQVESVVLAEYPDATIERLETDVDGASFEAHITQADDSRLTVLLDESFAITGTETGGPRGRGDCDGGAGDSGDEDAGTDAS